MNKGKKNELTAEQQAKAECDAKITLKKKEGYSEELPGDKHELGSISLDDIPKEFCPAKPISDCPQSVLNSHETIAQRKYNGHCVFLVKGKKKEKIYSRRMEDLTPQCKDLPFIKEQMSLISPGEFVLSEVTFEHAKLAKEIPRFVAQVIRNETPSEAMARYKELLKEGKFFCRPFDILFHKHKFAGDKNYIDRWALLGSLKLKDTVDFLHWWGPDSVMIEEARKNKWEGFVLRNLDKSQISYSMDGKAHREGSYKFKFTKPGDFVVDEVLKGKSGKHSQFYSKFHIIEYSTNGDVIDRGYVGPGTLTHEQLIELTNEIDTGKRSIPFVVEITYQSIHDDTGRLEFGIIQRLREDKKPEECVTEE